MFQKNKKFKNKDRDKDRDREKDNKKKEYLLTLKTKKLIKAILMFLVATIVTLSFLINQELLVSGL